MNSDGSFSANYEDARRTFRAAVAAAGGQIETATHPERGPNGDELTTDVAWFGPRDAERVLVTISGTHGVEGFCGSGAQVDWITRREATRLPRSCAALCIHAINPYGFAWLRRVTHENVDLNRNWVPFGKTLPENPGYDELADALCPREWSEASIASSTAVLVGYAQRVGATALQSAVSAGQYRHPTGIFYGGTSPTWSRQTQARIFATYLGHAARVAIIDYHSGLGPWGYGERIVPRTLGTSEFARAANWYGCAITCPFNGTSASAAIVGDGLSAAITLLPDAEVTGLALEVGTLPLDQILFALRADAWLHTHGDPHSAPGEAIQRQVRDAFYVDDAFWKGMVAAQSLLLCRQAIAGLTQD